MAAGTVDHSESRYDIRLHFNVYIHAVFGKISVLLFIKKVARIHKSSRYAARDDMHASQFMSSSASASRCNSSSCLQWAFPSSALKRHATMRTNRPRARHPSAYADTDPLSCM